jgi:hypothetical protein
MRRHVTDPAYRADVISRDGWESMEWGRFRDRGGSSPHRGGRVLSSAPAQPCEWKAVSTGARSISLRTATYRSILEDAGMRLVDERDDEGENHYFLANRPTQKEST